MSYSGQQGKKRQLSDLPQNEQKDRPWNEQPDPQGYEQGDLQGGGGSSVTPAPKRDGISRPVPRRSIEEYIDLGASQNIAGGGSIGHTDTSHNTTVPHNTSKSRNTATTYSNNTPSNTRAYNNSKHSEITNSEIHGGASFNTQNYNTLQHAPRMDARTYGDLQKLVQTIDWDTLSIQLSVIDQDEHRSMISDFNRDEPENFWITKNLDFMRWERDNNLRALLLSAPPGHRTTEICSHFINNAIGKDSQADGPVLYFFCSSATKSRCSTYLTHTLLHQIVHCSNTGKSNSIAVAFLSTLVDGHFQRGSPDFWLNDDPELKVQKVLNAPDNELIEALAEALKKAGIQKLSIMVDGLWEGIADWFVQFIMDGAPQLKALLTSRPNSLQNIHDGILCIEYDKERQECLRSLQYDDTRYEKISEEHHGSLEWLWRHPQYLQWSASAASSLLYIEGKPGSGKSTLAKYLVKNLVQVPNASSSTVAHYFYTFRGTILESTHENMLRSILHSILEQDESAFFHFQPEFRNFRRRSHPEWPYEALKKVLSLFVNHPPTKPLFLVLDAMDESKEDDRRSIIELICKLCSDENPSNIKIFLASRPVAELKHRIREHHHVIIMQDQNMGDISRFADDFLNSDLRLSGNILRDATDYITKNAQGVFVWVSLVKYEMLNHVERGLPDAEILKCLKGLPKKLEDFYNFMFDRLERGHPLDIQDGIKLFRFILFALRPLTVVELREALALPDDNNTSYEDFQQNKTRAIVRRIEHCGGNFLEIKADGTVQLMHQTAREFLIRTIPNASNIKLEIDMAYRVITTTWIRYLMLCFTSPSMRDTFSKIESWSLRDFQTYAEYLNDWPLIEYTLHYIKDHIDLCGRNEDVSSLPTALIMQLASNQASYFLGSFLNFRFGYIYGQAIPVNEYQETSENIKYSTLNAAAEPKLPHIVEALLLTCTQDAPHAQRKTPLIISVQKGLAGATQLLLDRHDDKDTKDDSGRTALHYAAENGDEAIVQLLVEQGAHERIWDNSEKTALHIAVKKFPNDSKGRKIHLYGSRVHLILRGYDFFDDVFFPYHGRGRCADLGGHLCDDGILDGLGFEALLDHDDLPPIIRILY